MALDGTGLEQLVITAEANEILHDMRAVGAVGLVVQKRVWRRVGRRIERAERGAEHS